jgi:hypothetical protein
MIKWRAVVAIHESPEGVNLGRDIREYPLRKEKVYDIQTLNWYE